jgi:hypothetical protein
MLTLLCGRPKPSRAMAEIVARGARIPEIEAGEIVLRIRIAGAAPFNGRFDLVNLPARTVPSY